MRKKTAIEKRISDLEKSILKYQENINSQYATDGEREYWRNTLIPSIKIRIDELKWVLGVF